MTRTKKADCEAMDRDDPLAHFRSEFLLPEGVIYLNGNSLGAMPKAAAERARRVVEHEWALGLIGSMNAAGWYDLPSHLGRKAAAVIGAQPHEVILTDSTSINLCKVMAAALEVRSDRRVIVMEGSNFPTNNYIVQGLIKALGRGHEIRFAEGGEIETAIDEHVAVVCLTQVHYRSGRLHDMADITARAHAAGAVAVWDLCHSAGAMPVDLNDCGVDFAVSCTYKYLNCGPGAPAILFVAERHHGHYTQPLTGWYAHAAPFEFERDYRPAKGIRQMLTGTQPTVSLSLAEPGLDLMLRADLDAIRTKSCLLTELFIELVEERLGDSGMQLASPRPADERGSQVSFLCDHGYPIVRALHDAGVLCDFRAPGLMRFGFAPLYIRYIDVWDAVERLGEILSRGTWRKPKFQVREAVT